MAKWLKWAALTLLALGLVWGAAPARVQAANIHKVMGNYTVGRGQTVYGNIDVQMGNVNIYGRVYGNVVVQMGNLTVDGGVVTGNVAVDLGNIQVLGGGRIEGSQTDNLGNVNGNDRLTPSAVGRGPWANFFPGGSVAWGWVHGLFGNVGWTARFLGRLAANLVVAAIMILLFPRLIRQIVVGVTETPARAAAIGCLSLAAWVVAMIGLAVIIVGIPVTLLLALAGGAAWLLANGAVVWLVGSRAVRAAWPAQETEWYWIVLLGGIVVTLVELIPVVGFLAELAVFVLGVGALVQSRLGFLNPGGPA